MSLPVVLRPEAIQDAEEVRQFPFVVYYRVRDDRIEVLAVMHGGRDPSAWQARA